MGGRGRACYLDRDVVLQVLPLEPHVFVCGLLFAVHAVSKHTRTAAPWLETTLASHPCPSFSLQA